ncbi:MAG: M23 family metallopeptidase, partial [Deltaproteobacteria bacterium]|nr:M23 family metallopeptidase [Deltaproteobacteria bacterium]
TWHRVEEGDTARSIAERYGADPEGLAEVNDLPTDGEITRRDEVFVPKKGGAAPGTGAPPPEPLGSTEAPQAAAVSGCEGSGRLCLAWPLDGEVSSGFGERGGKPHDGIDIPASRGAPVKAAADGVVLYSGDEIKGYGNLVIIRHEGGVITVYAHGDKNLVSEGDEIEKGQQVALVGDSGTASTTHLHFEVRVDEQPRDPLGYLIPREKK